MTPTKRELFSLNLNEDIIKFQAILWNKYCDARKRTLIDWPSEELKSSQLEFNNKITLYQKENYSKWSPILALVREDMINQGESISPVNFVNDCQFLRSLLKAHDWLIKQNYATNLALQSFIKNILVVDCDDLVACSSFKFLGTIIIAPKITWCLADYVENLIHEMSHIDLFIRQLIDPIVEKNVLLDSPFRKNKRPTIGVFHAAFVLSRVVKLLAALLNDQYEAELTRFRLLNNYQNLIAALDTLKNAPFLTNVAKMLLEEMTEHSLLYREFVL
ncbi:MAG: HEXXH motif-containing putative peptide modification protein [Legionella sp.]|nr:HEXXH motif-containing putative peptide modification protein [Legionella sp.]